MDAKTRHPPARSMNRLLARTVQGALQPDRDAVRAYGER